MTADLATVHSAHAAWRPWNFLRNWLAMAGIGGRWAVILPPMLWLCIFFLIPLVVVILWLGIYPRPFLDRMEPSVRNLLEEVTAPRSAPEAALPAGMMVATALTPAPTYR